MKSGADGDAEFEVTQVGRFRLFRNVSHRSLSTVSGKLGRKDEAQSMLDKLRAQELQASAETVRNWIRLWNMKEDDLAKFIDGVSNSGIL
ncbi:hypothetical protein [Hyphomicrobium sp. 99]|uniref:hypothetical protein n=1 Tax=Hyphomicrobium sp. 99 TaxID=1163419 RepID=UPI0005F7CCCD|nr:hypothetical protein [Hyphomicrobium sp. 99]